MCIKEPYMHELTNNIFSTICKLPFMVQVTEGLLHFPSAPHVIFVSPMRSNPVLHDWVAVLPYVVVPASASSTVPFLGLAGEWQSANMKKSKNLKKDKTAKKKNNKQSGQFLDFVT